MKFAHLADVHLGYKQFNREERYKDFFNAFDDAVNKIIDQNCDFVLIAGDLFDSIPKPHIINDAIEILKKLKKENIPVFAIEGNHDKTERVISPIFLLSNIGLVNYVGFSRYKANGEYNKNKQIGNVYLNYGEYEDVGIYGISYRRDKENIKKLMSYIEPSKNYNILLFHQTVLDDILKNQMYIPDVDISYSELSCYDFDYIAIGHIHKKYIFPNKRMAYSGSLEMCSMSECDYKNFNRIPENRKGFLIYENGKFIDIETTHRLSYDVSLKSVESVEDIFSIFDNLPQESIVKIKYKGKKIDENRIWRRYGEDYIITSVYYEKPVERIKKELTFDFNHSSSLKTFIRKILSCKKSRTMDFEELKEIIKNS